MILTSFNDPIPFESREVAESLSFTYHINTFDYPILHGHKDIWEFTLMTNGAIENQLNGKSYLCPAGTVFFAGPGDVHRLIKAGTEKPRYINIIIRETKLKELLSVLSPDMEFILRDSDHCFQMNASVILSVESLVHKANLDLGYSKQTDELLFAAFLLILQQAFVQCINVPEDLSPFETKVLALSSREEFLTYTVSDLCTELHYSRVQLNRLFQKYFKITPHEYLLTKKLNYAASLLLKTSMSTAEIACTIGFSHLSQFSIDFKKLFQLTAGEYRKQKGTYFLNGKGPSVNQ